MLSLGVCVLCLVGFLLAEAWAMGLAARWVGSERGRFGPAVRCVGLIAVVGIGLAVATAALASTVAPPPPPPTTRLPMPLPRITMPDLSAQHEIDMAAATRARTAITAASAALQLVVVFAIICRTFRLSAGRASAPFGAYLAVGVGVLAFQLLVLRRYVIEGFVIPTASMVPTLDVDDHILVDKQRQPRRWDLVVYRNTSGRQVQLFAKRLVGLPGEVLTFDGSGGVLINGVAVPVPAVLAGRCHAAPSGPARTMAKYADGEAIRLTDRQVFLIGDNIDRSYDSRMVGPSDRSAMIGVVEWTYWPPVHARLLRW